MKKKTIGAQPTFSRREIRKRRMAQRDMLLSVVISTMVFLVVRALWQISWEGSDDFNISHILAGTYGESSPYVLVMQYPLSWLLYRLYAVFPTLNLLGLAELLSVWLSFVVFDYLLIRKSPKWGVCLAMIFSVLFEPTFCLNLSYTRAATLLVMAGLSLLVYCVDARSGWVVQLASLLMLWAGMMFRWSAGYIAIPYAGLILLFSHWDILKVKEKRNRLLALGGVLLVGLLLISTVDNRAYEQFARESDWMEFNSARASMVDYMPGTYPEDGDMPVSANDYRMIQYSMIFDDYYSAELFEEAAGAIDVETSTLQGRLDSFWSKIPNDIIRYVRNGKMVGDYNAFVLLLFSLLISCVFVSKKNILMVLLSIGGTMVICFYFIWNGRFPPWVQDPLYLTAAFGLLYTVDFERSLVRKLLDKRYFRRVFSVFAVIGVLAMTIVSVKQGDVRDSRNYNNRELHQIMEMIEADKEHIYLIDSASYFPFPIMDGYPIWEAQEFGSWSNIFRIGTWFWRHPVIDAQLERLGIESLIRDIPNKEIVILTVIDSSTLGMFTTFLSEHYQMDTVPELYWSGSQYALYKLVYQ